MIRLKDSLTLRFPALASRDFAIFWGTFFMSLIGTAMQNTALPILAYHLSGSRFYLGLIGAASAFPTLLLALPGGVLVEHMDKRRLVILLQLVMLVQALALAILTLTGSIRIWHILLLSLLLGTAMAVEITARQAMLVELVGKEALPNAIALQSTAFNAARVIGPSLVAPFLLFIPARGEGWVFLANAVSFLFIVIGLTFVRTPFRLTARPERRNWIVEMRDGWSYIRGTPVVFSLIILAALIGLLAFPILQQFPSIAKDVLSQAGDSKAQADARASALYTAQGAGALIAASYLAANSNIRRKGRMLIFGQYAYMLGMVALAFSRTLPLTILIVLVMNWGAVSQLQMMNVLIQTQVPNGLRGRVFSTYLWALQGIAPVGSLLIGGMAQAWGVPVTALACGILCILAVSLIHLKNPAILKSEA